MAKKNYVTLGLATLFLTACGNNDVAMQQKPAGIPARVDSPKVRQITDSDEFTGRFRAISRVELRARVSGYLNSINFVDGQMVEKDDVLFVIDQRPFKIAVERAEAKFVLAEKEFKRAEKLRKSGTVSEADYDQRLQDMRIAKTELDDAKLNLEFTEIKAPFKGRMSRNLMDIGALVNANSTLLSTLVSTGKIEFYFDGSESDFLRYVRNQGKGGRPGPEHAKDCDVAVKLQDETDFVHKGEVDFINNELDEGTGTIQIRAVFDNEKQALSPGMFGRIRISSVESHEGIVVPDSIIGTEQTRKYVYVLDKDNKATRKYLKLGKLTKDGFRIVKDGLDINDRLIMGNLHMIQPGGLVSPIPTQVAEKNRGG